MGLIKIEFPCGYKFEIKTNLFESFEWGSLKYNECPLHGKGCKRKQKIGERK